MIEDNSNGSHQLMMMMIVGRSHNVDFISKARKIIVVVVVIIDVVIASSQVNNHRLKMAKYRQDK